MHQTIITSKAPRILQTPIFEIKILQQTVPAKKASPEPRFEDMAVKAVAVVLSEGGNQRADISEQEAMVIQPAIPLHVETMATTLNMSMCTTLSLID